LPRQGISVENRQVFAVGTWFGSGIAPQSSKPRVCTAGVRRARLFPPMLGPLAVVSVPAPHTRRPNSSRQRRASLARRSAIVAGAPLEWRPETRRVQYTTARQP
jgi:hypothetical protein